MNEHIRVKALVDMEVGFRMVAANTVEHRVIVVGEAEAEVCCTGADRMKAGRTATGVDCTDSGHTVAEVRTADNSDMVRVATRTAPMRNLVVEARTDKKVNTVADPH